MRLPQLELTPVNQEPALAGRYVQPARHCAHAGTRGMAGHKLLGQRRGVGRGAWVWLNQINFCLLGFHAGGQADRRLPQATKLGRGGHSPIISPLKVQSSSTHEPLPMPSHAQSPLVQFYRQKLRLRRFILTLVATFIQKVKLTEHFPSCLVMRS
jgi:hypothetical protein